MEDKIFKVGEEVEIVNIMSNDQFGLKGTKAIIEEKLEGDYYYLSTNGYRWSGHCLKLIKSISQIESEIIIENRKLEDVRYDIKCLQNKENRILQKIEKLIKEKENKMTSV
jgi:hypothetical protein